MAHREGPTDRDWGTRRGLGSSSPRRVSPSRGRPRHPLQSPRATDPFGEAASRATTLQREVVQTGTGGDLGRTESRTSHRRGRRLLDVLWKEPLPELLPRALQTNE